MGQQPTSTFADTRNGLRDGVKPRVMWAAVKAYDRRRRARRIGFAALSGGSAAAAAALAAGIGAFFLGRHLARR